LEAIGGISQRVPYDDCFEIAGMEEAAHFMFHQEKSGFGKEGIVTNIPHMTEFTREMERRAMWWKLAYVKRYMPRYYSSLKKTHNSVSMLLDFYRKSQSSFSQEK